MRASQDLVLKTKKLANRQEVKNAKKYPWGIKNLLGFLCGLSGLENQHSRRMLLDFPIRFVFDILTSYSYTNSDRCTMNKRRKDSQPSESSKERDSRDDPSSLPGWPGYRTRDGRSGYDPIDMRTEAAHTASTFVRDLFTGRLSIKNPILLLLSGALGLALVTPLLLAIVEMLNGNLLPVGAWLTFLTAGIVGLALLFNLVKNLLKPNKKP